MACILKPYIDSSKGILSLTTQEKRIIEKNAMLREKIRNIKKKYFIGLHFNWHDDHFVPDDLYDFYMAGEEDLKTTSADTYHLINMDACNFTPSCYNPSRGDKFWDILAVGNPVFFKRPEVLLNSIRALYDRSVGSRPKVLYVCPIPTYKKSDEKSVFYDIRAYYDALFSRAEKEDFTLLTTTFNSPFPFNRETLSVFFKNSKIFIHGADNERRCRIAAFAWCCGLPVVAKSSVASILPERLRVEPAFYEVQDDQQYADLILKALEHYPSFSPEAYQRELSEIYTVHTFEKKLFDFFEKRSMTYRGVLYAQNLDMRLGWHHEGMGSTVNGCNQSLEAFFKEVEALGSETIQFLYEVPFPEKYLAQEWGDEKRGPVDFKSPYLKKEPTVIEKVKYIVRKIVVS